tara:strand:- start:992 stop:1111 length:120 start_codon:yes stop_codon:yes gene_type:complete
VAAGNFAGVQQRCGIDVARAHHFGDLFEDKDELMLLPLT